MSEKVRDYSAGVGAEQLAELFHATYERLAPEYGYTTRTDTRRFDRGTENGKLMTAVCDYILTWFDESAPAEIARLTARVAELEAETAELRAWRDQAVANCAKRRCATRERDRNEAETERDCLRAALEKSADTFADMKVAMRILGRELVVKACEIAEAGAREALAQQPAGAPRSSTGVARTE